MYGFHSRQAAEQTLQSSSLFLYLAIMPILTIIQTLTQYLLSNRNLYFTPKAMVATGSIMLCGWVVVVSIWTNCEIIQPNSNTNSLPNWCPQSALSTPTILGVMFERGLTIIKDALGWVVTLSYVAYLAFASLTLRKERMEEKDNDTRLGMELESS
jgi:hypothetical protein